MKGLEKDRRICLFLDFDGTLAAIKKRPEQVRLHPSKKKILNELSRKCILTIVTGRAMKDIKRLIGIKNIFYIGNHGLEISFKGKNWIHPQALKISFILKRSLKKISREIAPFQGAWIEDKGLTASIHFRSMRKNLKPALKSILLAEIKTSGGALRLTEGKMVFEIRPNIPWDKGQGIKKFLKCIGRPFKYPKIYIGDDATDEDVFKIFGKNDISIKVGHDGYTHALYEFKDIHCVWGFLKEMRTVSRILS